MPNRYVYKVRYDAGGAPCAHRRVLSLAICKPRIRASAVPGDWIYGFGANRLDGRLIYVAEVTEKLEHGDYYRHRVYRKRPDAVYAWRRGVLRWKRRARFHGPEDAPKDVGLWPYYENANVLVSRNFRYLGGAGTTNWKFRFPHLHELMCRLGQGHRVNHSEAVARELVALTRTLWRRRGNGPVLGPPSDGGTPWCDR